MLCCCFSFNTDFFIRIIYYNICILISLNIIFRILINWERKGNFNKTCMSVVHLGETACLLMFHLWFYLLVFLISREEIDRLNAENDMLELQLTKEMTKNKEEASNRKKLERVLSDAANALKLTLRVSHWFVFLYN